MTSTIWLNVSDLLPGKRNRSRPNGIQRIMYETCRGLLSLISEDVVIGFVVTDESCAALEIVGWDLIESSFRHLATHHHQTTELIGPPPVPHVSTQSRKSIRNNVYRLPVEIRRPLMLAYFKQRQAVRQLKEILLTLRKSVKNRQPPQDLGPKTHPKRSVLTMKACAGDIIITMGAAWNEPHYCQIIRDARASGIRHAVVIHDLTALFRPELSQPGVAEAFSAYCTELIPLSDLIFSISEWTAETVRRHWRNINPVVLPLGTGFTAYGTPTDRRRTPPERSFVLYVSSIQPSKEHALLFHIWRRLLDELPPDAVPTLVFAGSVALLTEDLMAQLSNCRNLDGHIVLFLEPSDAELSVLYKECLFTVFPSRYEGWPLPVGESLFFGRPCIAANSSSLPEAGGQYIRYFAEGNGTAALELIRAAIVDKTRLQSWADDIVRSFQPTSWQVTAQSIVAATRGKFGGL